MRFWRYKMTNKIEMNDFIGNYIQNAPNKQAIHYWDLPDGICTRITNPPKKLRIRGETFTVGKLKRTFDYDPRIEKHIRSIVNWRNKKHEIKVNFPISLLNENYVQIYSLMLSEGSYKTEFKLHVPEEEFHEMFAKCLRNLFGNLHINQAIEKGIKRSRAPKNISYLLPIPDHIPRFIIDNKEFARIYLKIAFEAEANFRYKILKNGAVNRRIKLSRNVGIDNIIKEKLPYEEGKRIYFGTLKRDFPKLANKINKRPCPTIIGEATLLKKHFDIDSSLRPEYLRINKTPFRAGRISVKWTLCIYSVNIDKFVKEIGFITKYKSQIGKKMLKVKLQRPRHFALGIMKKVAEGNVFDSNDYEKEAKTFGYQHPKVFLAKYRKKKLIKKIGHRMYQLKPVSRQHLIS